MLLSSLSRTRSIVLRAPSWINLHWHTASATFPRHTGCRERGAVPTMTGRSAENVFLLATWCLGDFFDAVDRREQEPDRRRLQDSRKRHRLAGSADRASDEADHRVDRSPPHAQER